MGEAKRRGTFEHRLQARVQAGRTTEQEAQRLLRERDALRHDMERMLHDMDVKKHGEEVAERRAHDRSRSIVGPGFLSIAEMAALQRQHGGKTYLPLSIQQRREMANLQPSDLEVPEGLRPTDTPAGREGTQDEPAAD